MGLGDFIKINKSRIINVSILYFLLPILISSFLGEAVIAILYTKYFPLTKSLIIISQVIHGLLLLGAIFSITLGFMKFNYILVQDEELEESNAMSYIIENKKLLCKFFFIILIFLFAWIGILLVGRNIGNKYFLLGVLIVSSIILTYGIYIIISSILYKTLIISGFKPKETISNKLTMFKDTKFIGALIINLVLTIFLFRFLHTPIINGIVLSLIVIGFIFLNVYIIFGNID